MSGRKGDAGHGAPKVRRGRAIALALALTSVSCGPEEARTISRENFVEAYVALRGAELSSRDAVITEAVRDSVLAARGIEPADMLAFAEVHGGDAEFMEGVWSEVQERMEALNRDR